MEQRKRPGGDGGLGYYTSWEKSKGNGCIYCGKPATTREHVPSKAFLVEPYPENLSTIPACFECNNGYSEDEKYVACFLDVLKSHIYLDYKLQKETDSRLSKDEKLKSILNEQIRTEDGKVFIRPDNQRIQRILLKLAKGHAGFELDYVNFDNTETQIWYAFIFNMSENDLYEFNSIPTYQVYPEVGSRGMYIIQNIVTDDAQTFANWMDVQDGQYRYQVSYNDNDSISVKIVILELLYCEVNFE